MRLTSVQAYFEVVPIELYAGLPLLLLIGIRREQRRKFGHGAFTEFTDVYEIQRKLEEKFEQEFNKMVT